MCFDIRPLFPFKFDSLQKMIHKQKLHQQVELLKVSINKPRLQPELIVGKQYLRQGYPVFLPED